MSWDTTGKILKYNGSPVVLKGFVLTCTEYLIHGIGTPCICAYNWNDHNNIITNLNMDVVNAIQGYFANPPTGVIPALRVCLTAQSWTGPVPESSEYPDITGQYQTLIQKLVTSFTSKGIIVILDQHWDTQADLQKEMPIRSNVTSDGTNVSLAFWDSASKMFGSNPLVWYELYNEPYLQDVNAWMDGDSTYVGMMEMYNVVRKNSSNGVVVIAGTPGYAYNTSSLITLEQKYGNQLHNAIFNYHPYMGANQQGDNTKTAEGFQTMINTLWQSVSRPVIITEFGQYCCPPDGACYIYPGTFNGKPMGYVQAILEICTANNISWTVWAWRPQATTAVCADPDINSGYKLADAINNQGANFATLWKQYFSGGSPPPPGKCTGVNCGQYGSCDPTTGKCVCTYGFSGNNCETPPSCTPPFRSTEIASYCKKQKTGGFTLSKGEKTAFIVIGIILIIIAIAVIIVLLKKHEAKSTWIIPIITGIIALFLLFSGIFAKS